jgi:hypothetical protein
MGKVIRCPKGQWTTLINNTASRMPATWTVDFRSPDGQIAGRVREARSFLPLGLAMKSDGESPLRPAMSFERYWTNASYRLEVCPDSDLEAHFR